MAILRTPQSLVVSAYLLHGGRLGTRQLPLGFLPRRLLRRSELHCHAALGAAGRPLAEGGGPHEPAPLVCPPGAPHHYSTHRRHLVLATLVWPGRCQLCCTLAIRSVTRWLPCALQIHNPECAGAAAPAAGCSFHKEVTSFPIYKMRRTLSAFTFIQNQSAIYLIIWNIYQKLYL